MSVLGKRGGRDEPEQGPHKRGRAIYAMPRPVAPPSAADIHVALGSKRKAGELGRNRAKRIRTLHEQQQQALALETQIQMYRTQLQNAHAQYMHSQRVSRERLKMVVDAKKESGELRQQILALIKRINGLEALVKKKQQEILLLGRKYSMCSEHIRTLTGHSPSHAGGRLVL